MGNLGREGIRSAVFIFFGFAVATVSNLYLLPFWFSKEELGQVQLIINWALLLSQFLSLGSASIAVRFLPALSLKGEQGKVFFLCLILPLIGTTLFGIYLLFFSDYFLASLTDKLLFAPLDAIWVIFGMTFFQSFIKSYGGLAISRRVVSVNFMLNEFYIRLVIVAGYYLCFAGWITYTGLFYFIMAGFMSQALLLIVLQGGVWFSKKDFPRRAEFKEYFSFGSYSMLDSGVTALVNRLDVIMIGYFLVNANMHAQEYVMAINITTMMLLPWRSIIAAASPFVSEAFAKNDITKVGELYKKLSLNGFLMGGFIFVVILAGIPEIFAIIPDNYSAAIVPVILLGFSKITDMLTSNNHMIILMSKYYRWNLYFGVIAVVLTIVLNAVFIPWFNNINGTAIATIVTLVIYNICKGVFVFRKLGIHPFHHKTPHAIVLLGMLFTVGYFFPVVSQNPLINMVVKSMVICFGFGISIVFLHISEDLRKTGRRYLGYIGIRLKG